MLLKDAQSPVISNFLHLLTYNDGSEMPSYDQYCKTWDPEQAESAHLEKYLQEAKKMEVLIG